MSVGLSVSLYVCLSNNNFRKPRRRKFIFAHQMYLDGIRVKIISEVTRSRSSSHEQKSRKLLLLLIHQYLACRKPKLQGQVSQDRKTPTSTVQNFNYPWCDRHLCHVTLKSPCVTKCTHLRVVALRLEGNLVFTLMFFNSSTYSFWHSTANLQFGG